MEYEDPLSTDPGDSYVAALYVELVSRGKIRADSGKPVQIIEDLQCILCSGGCPGCGFELLARFLLRDADLRRREKPAYHLENRCIVYSFPPTVSAVGMPTATLFSGCSGKVARTSRRPPRAPT